jgi:glucokinase
MTREAVAAHPESSMAAEEKITGRTAFNHMRAGDAAAKEVVDTYIRYLAAGITNTINIFQPDVLCIGGGVCNEGDPLLLPMKEIVARENYTRNSPKNAEIVIAKLGNDAGIIGAAFLGNAK